MDLPDVYRTLAGWLCFPVAPQTPRQDNKEHMMEINRHDNPWVQIEQLQMEVERLQVESAKLVDENNRLQEWKDAAIAQAEDMHEYVLATINTEKAKEIERLRGENEDLALEAKDAWALVKTMREKPGPN